MKYIYNLLPVCMWKSEEIGIIYKIWLTIISFIAGLIGGTWLTLTVLLKPQYSGDGAILILLMGISLLLHYIFVLQGFKHKSAKKITISYIILALFFYLYYGIIAGVIYWLWNGIPLMAARRAFKKLAKSDDIEL